MIMYTVEVYSKWRENEDHDYLESDRYNFEDALKFIKMLRYYPFEINEIVLKQYAHNLNGERCRVTLLNCFNVVFPCNNMIFEPKFELVNVSNIGVCR